MRVKMCVLTQTEVFIVIAQISAIQYTVMGSLVKVSPYIDSYMQF